MVTTTTVAPVAIPARVVQPVKVASVSVQEVPPSVAAVAVRLVNHALVEFVVDKWVQPV